MEYLHTMIRVRDLDESLAFYIDLLGFEEVRRTDSDDDRATCVLLAASDDSDRARSPNFSPVIELFCQWDETERRAKGRRAFGRVGYRVDDIYAACEQLLARGIVLNRPPRDGSRACFKSPEGMTIELIQRWPPLAPAEPWLSLPDTGIWND